MIDTQPPTNSSDPHTLHRFVQAQAQDYGQALAEIKSGRKRSHWMWYIFPQFEGLGRSATSQRYAIKSLAEAEAYRQHPLLGPRLIACVEAVLQLEGKSAYEVFGSPDDLKLHSCATLFTQIAPPDSAFKQLLDHYFQGKPDVKTLQLLEANNPD